METLRWFSGRRPKVADTIYTGVTQVPKATTSNNNQATSKHMLIAVPKPSTSYARVMLWSNGCQCKHNHLLNLRSRDACAVRTVSGPTCMVADYNAFELFVLRFVFSRKRGGVLTDGTPISFFRIVSLSLALALLAQSFVILSLRSEAGE